MRERCSRWVQKTRDIRIRRIRRAGRFRYFIWLFALAALSCTKVATDQVEPPTRSAGGVVEPATTIDRVVPPAEEGKKDLGHVLFVGDSITLTASSYIESEFDSKVDGTIEFIAVGGTSPCDVIGMIEEAFRRTPPDSPPNLLVMEWYGNNLTPCMGSFDGDAGGYTIGSVEFLDAYYEAFTRVAREARTYGIPVIWATPPPRHPDAVAPDLQERLESMAHGFGWRIVDAGVAVSENGSWTTTMPCLRFERERSFCIDGRVRVRSSDRVHFETFERDIPGALRWAEALIDGL